MYDDFNAMLGPVFGRFLTSLEVSERAPRTQHHAHQQGLLRRLLRHAHDTTPFYRKHLAGLFTGDEIDLSRWRTVPIVTRADIVAHQNEMLSTALPAEAGPVSSGTTTGTTGKLLRVPFNELNRTAAFASLARTARWWDLDTSERMAKIVIYLADDSKSYPHGQDRRGWCLSHPDAPTHLLDMFTPVPEQIEWLLRKKPTYLTTSPVNATALAYAISPEQARELGLKAILALGETVLPLARRVVPERFGAPLIAIYSCQEVGFIATQCPVTPHYHVMSENVLVEILREDGTPAAPGEAGQVVVTGFYNYAMPFIRYAIGDVATPGPETCACGMTLPVIAHVEGRTRHSFVFADGTRIWPRMGNFDVSPFLACREFQLVQVDHHTLELRYVPGDDRAPDVAGLEAYVHEKFHPTTALKLVNVPALPKGPGGKFTPFVSMVET
jgi:phenylacetate-CoA ligase